MDTTTRCPRVGVEEQDCIERNDKSEGRSDGNKPWRFHATVLRGKCMAPIMLAVDDLGQISEG